MAHQASKNRSIGAVFEKFFQTQSRLRGVFCEKNHLTARIMGFSGQPKILKSNLDFTLIYEGRVAFIDCKTFAGDHFTHSQIDPDQLKKAMLYNDLKVVSGFCVWFQKSGVVAFYDGRQINFAGARTRFEASDALYSARFDQFDIRVVLRA